MSGFLSRLIGRTRETAEVLRPRVASLFEPGEAARQVETSFESVAADAPVETLRRRRRVVMEGDVRDEVAPAVDVRRRFTEPDEQVPESSPAVQAEVKPDMGQRSVAEPEPRVSAKEEKPSIRAEARKEAIEQSRSAKTEREAVPEVRDVAAKPVGIRQSGEAEQLVTVVREERASIPPVQRIFAQSPAPSLVVPKQRPHFEAAQSLPRAAASEPVVEVTIGRIEVRAIAEAKGQKAKAGPAVMGLDEYLKTRGRGGRP
jgi:hypothetical protein